MHTMHTMFALPTMPRALQVPQVNTNNAECSNFQMRIDHFLRMPITMITHTQLAVDDKEAFGGRLLD